MLIKIVLQFLKQKPHNTIRTLILIATGRGICMKVRKIATFLVVCLSVLSLNGGLGKPSLAAELEPLTLLYPHTSPLTEANALMADLFKKYAEERTGGKLTIEVMPAAQMGTAQETAQQLQDGSVHISSEQVYSIVDFIPQAAVFDMLFMFSTYDKNMIDKTINAGPMNEYLRQKYNDVGFELLGYMQAATFRETTSTKELRSPDDFKGLKIRTLPSNNFVVGWQALETNPTPITIGELYLALQQHLVESQENPYDIVLSNNFNEVQKYLCATHHNLYVMHIIMNKSFYESLPKEYQEAIQYASERARKEIGASMPELAEKSKKTLLDRGMIFIEYDDAAFTKFREKIQPAWNSIRKIAGDETVDLMIKQLEEAKASVQ
jgi:tripartite ATP-independent transporter DctP family solute receptor